MPVPSVVLACAQILVFIATIQWLITSSMMRTDKDHEDLVKGGPTKGSRATETARPASTRMKIIQIFETFRLLNYIYFINKSQCQVIKL